MNLIDGKINHSNLFLHMPLFDEIFDEGFLEGKIRTFKAVREDQPCRMLVLNMIRKDEAVIWDAFQDLLKRSIAETSYGVSGVYVFDVLTMDIHQEVQSYRHAEICRVLKSQFAKCAPGQKRLVSYSTIYGIVQKLSPADWGKITLKTAVEVFKDKDDFLDLLIKQLIGNFEFSNVPGVLLLNDLSREPVFDPRNDRQQKRIAHVLERQIPLSIEFLPEVYIQDKNGVRELLSGSVIDPVCP